MAVVASLYQPTSTPFIGVDETVRITRIYFKVVASGNYAALGDTLDFTALGDFIKSQYPPVYAEINSFKSGGTSGYFYAYIPGTTLANGVFQVLQCAGAGNPAADIGAGAYPAGVTGDTIIGFADFIRL